MMSLSDEERSLSSEELEKIPRQSWRTALEFVQAHGTESDDSFEFHTGNSEPQGFGHIGFIVDDLTAMCKDLEEADAQFFKRPEEGKMRGLAFVLDPSGYRIELIQRGMAVDP